MHVPCIRYNALFRFLKEMSQRRGPWAFGRTPLILTFQKAVADRIVGSVGSRYTRSRLSLIAQYVSHPSVLFDIPGKILSILCFSLRLALQSALNLVAPRSTGGKGEKASISIS